MDAALALSTSPIFRLLGRIDLAKLAGELEDVELAHGETLMREGEAGDSFSVVRAGEALVHRGADPDPASSLSVGPGAVIGEMAILTGATRTASVRARGPLSLWRMSADRFLALLAAERPIALAVERALCQRLSDMSADADHRRADAEALARTLVARMGSEAARTLARLSTRPRWPVATLALAEEDAARIADLAAEGILLRRDGDEIVVMGSLVGLFPRDAETTSWLSGLADASARAGRADEALDLLLAAGKADAAARLAAENGPVLIPAATAARRARWVEALSAAGAPPALVDAARSALALGVDVAPTDEVRADGAPLLARLRAFAARYVVEGRILSACLAAAIVAVGWLAPPAEGLSREGFAALMVIVATVPLLLAEALPRYLTVMIMAAAMVIPGLVTPNVALAGFSSPSWLLIMVLFATSGAVGRSGLTYRVALGLLNVLPANLLVHALSLFGLGSLLSLGVAGANGRVILAAPAVRDMADSMHLPRGGKDTAFLGMATFFAFTGMGSLIITGTAVGLVAVGTLNPADRAAIGWIPWLTAAFVPHMIWMVTVLATLVLVYRPTFRANVDRERVALQIALLGPLTRNEILSILALAALGIGFATRSIHGIPDVWTAVGLVVVLFITGALDDRTFKTGVDWGVMLFYGVLMSLGGVMSSLGIDTWIGGLARGMLADVIGDPYAFVPGLAIICTILRFIFPKVTLAAMMALIAVPIASAAGYHPLVPVITLVLASDHSALPYVNETYPVMLNASEGHLFSNAQARIPLMVETVLRILAAWASVPVWHAMGLC